jgi:hypothetical protein
MISILLSLLISATPSDAGSICNDGTYSHSEGRGTCSHHGGVSTSGVYYDYNSYTPSVTSHVSNFKWKDGYGVTDSGLPYYNTRYSNGDILFAYSCYVRGVGIPGEAIFFIIRNNDLLDHPGDALATSNAIKVLTQTSSGLKLISGSWQWSVEDGIITVSKVNEVMGSLAEPLSKADLQNIISANYFVVSIDGIGSTIIGAPGIRSKIINTWSRCNASNK